MLWSGDFSDRIRLVTKLFRRQLENVLLRQVVSVGLRPANVRCVDVLFLVIPDGTLGLLILPGGSLGRSIDNPAAN
jgi:hypothetical protein